MDSLILTRAQGFVCRWRELAVRLAAWWEMPWVRWPVVAITGLTWVLILASPWAELLLRSDESWPHHRLFLIVKERQPERGDLAAFRMTPELAARVQPPRERPYARVGELWLKRVVGMAGDRVTLVSETRGRTRILINGYAVGVALPRDKFGQEIHAAALPAVIPEAHYYVALEHPRSFDSRYFGLVPDRFLIGTAQPLW